VVGVEDSHNNHIIKEFMKIAVTSQSSDINAQVDPRFGRAAYILIVDSNTMEFDVLNNEANVNALKGAGIQASVMIKEAGAEVLLTGFCGPNAIKTLNTANIKVVVDVTGKVKDALTLFNEGKINYITEANCEGHTV
jgi:predicted Fe-Mo cluster-binding NifX family protein